jgi:hypothetical protein
MDEELGGGGKKEDARTWLFSLFVTARLGSSGWCVLFSDRILELDEAPARVDIYLLATHRSLPEMSSNQSVQCCFFVFLILLEYLLCLMWYSSWIGCWVSSLCLYESRDSLVSSFFLLVRSFVYHLFEYGLGLEHGMQASAVLVMASISDVAAF